MKFTLRDLMLTPVGVGIVFGGDLAYRMSVDATHSSDRFVLGVSSVAISGLMFFVYKDIEDIYRRRKDR